MNKTYTALVALAAFALLVPAQAEELCYTTSSPELTIPGDAIGGDIYVDNDLCEPVVGDGTCTAAIWIYQETNGIAGLQRGDENVNDVINCTDGTTADLDLV